MNKQAIVDALLVKAELENKLFLAAGIAFAVLSVIHVFAY